MIAIGIVISRAYAARIPDRPTAPRIAGKTGWRFWNELPKSNVTRLRIARTYCSGSGSFVPSRSLIASTVSCGANGPAIVRPTSLGRTLAMMKTIVASSQSVTSESTSLRRSQRVIDACLTRDYATVDVDGRGATSAPLPACHGSRRPAKPS